MEKNAIITGASKRIGKAIANHLATKGWNLVLHYNQSGKEATDLQNKLSLKYPHQNFVTVKANLGETKDTNELIISSVNEIGILNMLVNNASIFEESDIKATTSELFERNIQINFSSPFFLIQNFAKQTQNGVIINIVDTRITTNQNSHAAYTLSKKALWELTKMAAFEYSPNIRVNAIAPGVTLPPPGGSENDLWQMAEKIPMQKPGGIDPILKSIDYIIENNHLTGQLLFCDGGENIGKR
jgi:pteridine reductase